MICWGNFGLLGKFLCNFHSKSKVKESRPQLFFNLGYRWVLSEFIVAQFFPPSQQWSEVSHLQFPDCHQPMIYLGQVHCPVMLVAWCHAFSAFVAWSVIMFVACSISCMLYVVCTSTMYWTRYVVNRSGAAINLYWLTHIYLMCVHIYDTCVGLHNY